MKIVIVGAGAIGRLFGALLGRGGHELVLVEIQRDVVDEINQRGIGVMAHGMENPDVMEYVPAAAVLDGREIKSCDAVLIAVKSYNTLAAIKSVSHLVTDNAPALSLQTGLGNVEIMENVVRKQNIIGGFTFMAGTALGPGDVRHGGIGKTYIGELDGTTTPRLEQLAEAFNACGIVTEILPEIMGNLWCKVIVFSAINPVSAILRIKNGQLLGRMESITLMKRLVDEGQQVATAHAVDLGCHDLYEVLMETCRQTANNMSSMLQDIVNLKMTEIDALNGALCRYGEERGVALPTHHTMIQLVKLFEHWGRGHG